MRRIVWTICLFFVALFAPVTQTQSKTIKLNCKIDDSLSAKIIVNDTYKSVLINLIATTKEFELRQTWGYRDGDFSRILKRDSVKVFDSSRQGDFGAKNNRTSLSPAHQRVLIWDQKIQFGTDSWLNTIDMGAGGIYYSHRGPKGSCDCEN